MFAVVCATAIVPALQDVVALVLVLFVFDGWNVLRPCLALPPLASPVVIS